MINSNKKSQGLSLNTVIIAALVLIVLVILMLFFSGRMTLFKRGIDYCDGHCESSVSDCNTNENPIFLVGCDENNDGEPDGGSYCCSSSK
jgi:hypothetical protein